MRKIISCVLCLAMVLSMGMTAFAADISIDGGSQNVTVTYGTSESFLVTIPASITILDEVSDFQISASNVMIGANKELVVEINGDDYVDKWELIDVANPDNRLEYAIQGPNGNVKNNDTVLSVLSGEAHDSTKTADFVFVRMDEATKSGTYTDTLTFTSEIKTSNVIIETTSTYLRPVLLEEENMIYVYLTDEGRELFNSVDWGSHEGYTNYVYYEGIMDVGRDWEGLTNGYITPNDFLVKFEFLTEGNYDFYLTDFCEATIIVTDNRANSQKFFIIDDTTYFMQENMTWGDWLNSGYVGEGFYAGDVYPVMYQTDGPPYYVIDGEGLISLDELIQNNGVYYLEYYDESSGDDDFQEDNYQYGEIYTFNFEGVDFEFEYGMTLSEWFSSDYNPTLYQLIESNIYLVDCEVYREAGIAMGTAYIPGEPEEYWPAVPISGDTMIYPGTSLWIEFSESPIFYLNDNPYFYELGMTFEDWVNSDYNTTDLVIMSGSLYHSSTDYYSDLSGIPDMYKNSVYGPRGIEDEIYPGANWSAS